MVDKMVEAIVRRSKYDGRITHAVRRDKSGHDHVARRTGSTEQQVRSLLKEYNTVVTLNGSWHYEMMPEDTEWAT